MPINRAGLAASCGAVLVCNMVLHAFLLKTRRVAPFFAASLVIDLVTISLGIYFSGMVSSPFAIVLPVTFFSVYFASMDRRLTVLYGAAAIVLYAVLFAVWWARSPEYPAWTPGRYPAYTLFIFCVHVLALSAYIYLSVQLNPLVEVLAKQEAMLQDQQRKAELGASLSVIAHELRTPLSVIGISAELIGRDGAGGEEGRERLAKHTAMIREGVTRIEELVTTVLAYARERRGEYSMRPCDLGVVARRAVDLIRLKHRGRAITAEIGAGYGRAPVAVCDENAIFHVLMNLLDNSAKAGVEGRGLKVVVNITREGDHALLAVSDNGSGIAPENLDRIFDRFYTGSTAGTGIGLFVCRKVVEDHAGTIEVSSRQGEGAIFTIRLPAGGAPGGGRDGVPAGRGT
jgi:signal transduction histidine kinase